MQTTSCGCTHIATVNVFVYRYRLGLAIANVVNIKLSTALNRKYYDERNKQNHESI